MAKHTEQQRHARRQRRRRDQHRAEQQKRERILQSAGEVKQRRELGDVEAEQIGGPLGLEPLRVPESRTRSAILSDGRKRDHAEAGPERNIEFEPEMHHQHGRELAENGEPAQPHQRIEPHIARPQMRAGQTEHGINVASGRPNPNKARDRRACRAPPRRSRMPGGARRVGRGLAAARLFDHRKQRARPPRRRPRRSRRR